MTHQARQAPGRTDEGAAHELISVLQSNAEPGAAGVTGGAGGVKAQDAIIPSAEAHLQAGDETHSVLSLAKMASCQSGPLNHCPAIVL